MRCHGCGKDNAPGSLFCQQCGARLVSQEPPAATPGTRACPRCGSATSTSLRFCTECGQPLGEAAAAAPAHVAPAPAAPAPVVPAPVAPAAAAPAPAVGVGAAGWQPTPAAGAVPPTVVTSAPRTDVASARLVAILKDGSDGQVYPLAGDQVDVGGQEGDVVLRDDPYLSPRHARISRRGDTFVLRDLDSVNGVYLRIRQPVDLCDGDMILAGQEVLRFETLPDAELPLGPACVHGVMLFGTPEVPRVARLVQYATEGVGRDVYYLYRDETILGRENGDVVFTDDPFLSRRHASVTVDRTHRRFVLRDLGSSNGTAVRLRAEHVLQDGDQFRVGRHLFRFDRVRAPGGRHSES
jgi:pSer/pThr/pTyr-binding forkhead associated (FHA) protein